MKKLLILFLFFSYSADSADDWVADVDAKNLHFKYHLIQTKNIVN